MNRSNYLFDACVSHRNTLMVQRNAEKFFANEEDKFYTDYNKHHYSYSLSDFLNAKDNEYIMHILRDMNHENDEFYMDAWDKYEQEYMDQSDTPFLDALCSLIK